MTETTYRFRLVCDETETPLDVTLFQFTIDTNGFPFADQFVSAIINILTSEVKGFTGIELFDLQLPDLSSILEWFKVFGIITNFV